MRIILVVLLVTGCASAPPKEYRWANSSGAPRSQLDTDMAQCQVQALRTHPLMSQEQVTAIFTACLRGKGWYLVER